MFQGFGDLAGSFSFTILVTNSSSTPVEPDAAPTYRVYGPSGYLAGQAGTMTLGNSGSITGATNASPIVVTSAAHGLTTGARVTISGVVGNTAANSTWTITRVDANSFSLNGSTGNAGYTSGGTWRVTGLYSATLTLTGANGYESGDHYTVLVTGAISTVAFAQLHTLQVG